MGNSEASSMISTTLERLSEAHGIDATLDALPGPVDDNAISDLSAIVEGVGAALPWVETAIDATLVRGMGYYTGAIFEIRHNELTGSLAGGGRYDKMIGKLSGTDVPAVGFSIGFERLYDLLEGRGRSVDAQRQRRIAMLYDSEASAAEVMAAAQHLRSQGDIVRTEPSVKNRGGQLKRLAEAGFTQWGEFRTDGEVVVQSLSEEAPSSSGDRL